MRLNDYGLYNLIISILAIILYTSIRIVIYKKRKNLSVINIVYVDSFTKADYAAIIFAVFFFIMMLYYVIFRKYNTSHVFIPGLIMLMVASLNAIQKIVISANGVGKKDFYGIITMFISWDNVKECRWLNNSTIKIIGQDDRKQEHTLMCKVSNEKKEQFKDLLKRYCRKFNN